LSTSLRREGEALVAPLGGEAVAFILLLPSAKQEYAIQLAPPPLLTV